MSKPKPIVVGLGELLWDLLPEGRQLGGAPANFAYRAHGLGGEACLVSMVGRDEEGETARTLLASKGLTTQYIGWDDGHATGTVEVELDARGQPGYRIRVDVAWDHLRMSPDLEGLAMRADAVCFGTLAQRGPTTRTTIRDFLSQVRAGCLRVPYFDAGLVRASLAWATVLKLNDDELPLLAEAVGSVCSLEAAALRIFEAFPVGLVALTKGEHGAVLVSRSERVDVPAQCPLGLVDTVGAGDAFTAALVMGLLAGNPLRAIAKHAAWLAGLACAGQGGMADINKFNAGRFQPGGDAL